MIEKYVKNIYQTTLVMPLVNKLSQYRIPPVLFTYLALLSGIAAGISLYRNSHLDAILLILLSGYFDTLDGTYARATSQNSPLGALYDVLSDRIVESAIVIGLFSIDPATRAWPAIFMLASILICVTSFLLVGILTPNNGEKSFHYSPGIMERLEAFVFFIIMILMPEYFKLLATVFTFLVLYTAQERVKQFRKESIYGDTTLNTA